MATPNRPSFLVSLLTLNIQAQTKKSFLWLYHDKGGGIPSIKIEGTVKEKARREEEKGDCFQHH